MKKYFLLATTALLLGTSNVMASDFNFSESVPMYVTASIYPAATLEIANHVSWGQIYVDATPSGADLGTFSTSGYTPGVDVKGYAGQVLGEVNLYNSMGADMVPEIDLGGASTLDMGDGLTMSNMSLESTAGGISGADTYILAARLSCSDDCTANGVYNKALTIKITY